MSRNLLFISHANPEDNEFSRWLALQLAKCGYRVWCDLTRLLGGEDFWSDIEGAIREHTCKFLYVLSRTSNHRPGTLQELYLADSVARKEGFADFIIPLRIDDLPHNEFNIQVARRNAIDFNGGWAIGLNQLLEKLDKDKVPKNPDFGPESVASWWKTQFATECQIINKPEVCVSNMFPIVEIPSTLFAHELSMYFRFLTKPARYLFRRHHHHLCRHTFAINYLLNGGDIFSLREILGHTTLEMVNHYLHFTSSQITAQHQKYSPMDKFFYQGEKSIQQ